MAKKGKLILIPIPIAEDAVHTIPQYVIDQMHALDVFIAERARTARRYIKSTEPERPISDLTIFELHKRVSREEKKSFLNPCFEGKNIGLMSEAGCPGVADPGAEIVEMAHEAGIQVVPLVGPSSILLALMASGMNGQRFAFEGYLPAKTNELKQSLKQLELLSKRLKQTQIFIETPYRNHAVVETVLKVLSPATHFCIACDLNGKDEYVVSKKVSEWRHTNIPDLHKRPAIFMILA